MDSANKVPKIRIINSETGEEFERELNSDELIQWQADKAKTEAQVVAREQAQIEKNALLEKLGITEEEAKLLLS